MGDEVPHQINITGIGKFEPFFEINEEQFKTGSILPELVFKQILITGCDIVISKGTYFSLIKFVPAYPIILIGKQCNNKSE